MLQLGDGFASLPSDPQNGIPVLLPSCYELGVPLLFDAADRFGLASRLIEALVEELVDLSELSTEIERREEPRVIPKLDLASEELLLPGIKILVQRGVRLPDFPNVVLIDDEEFLIPERHEALLLRGEPVSLLDQIFVEADRFSSLEFVICEQNLEFTLRGPRFWLWRSLSPDPR